MAKNYPYPRDKVPPDKVMVNEDKIDQTKRAKSLISKFECSDINRKNKGLGGYVDTINSRSMNNMDLSNSQLDDIKESLKTSAKKLDKKSPIKQNQVPPSKEKDQVQESEKSKKCKHRILEEISADGTMLSGLSALKNEIAAKKRSMEDKGLIGEKKYFKRGELLTKQADEYWSKHGGNRDGISGKDISPSKNSANGSNKADEANVEAAHILPRVEVIRRLRERDEPILLFGESEELAFRRLRRLEILEPEINRGLRNDFQDALEKVDKAYLNEILKTQDGGGASKDVPVIGEEITMESIIEEAKDLAKGDLVVRCKVVLNFVQLILRRWGSTHNSRVDRDKISVRGKMDSATYTQTQAYLKPLIKGLKKRSMQEDIMECLVEIVEHCLARDYIKANDVYLQMAIGNAAWPIGVTMVGIHARTGREKIFSKHVAHVLNDETQRKYIQGLKRLMTKCQDYYVAAPSKCVDYISDIK